MSPSREELAAVAQWLAQATSGVVFTGAGISTESGIPDFRSPGGVWSRYRTVYFQEFLESALARHEYWRQKSEAHRDFAAAEPNVAHRAIARWEAAGLIRGVVTQNIDGLHQLAGSRNVLEVHGTAREVACLSCSFRAPVDRFVEDFLKTDQVPDCPECGGLVKHATISFGQSLDPEVQQTAFQWSREADVYLAIGSSLVVQPAASMPEKAAQRGAKLIIINRDPTPLDALATLVLRGSIGQIVGEINQQLVTPEPG